MGANLADLVHEAAMRRPDTPAILGTGRVTTWSQLDRMVHAVAGGLTARRLEPGDRVALVLGNSLEFVIAYFAVLRAGLVAVPINTAYTAPEIAELLESSGARMVVADASTIEAVYEAAGAGVEIIEAGGDKWRRLSVGSTPPPSGETDPESLALLIYTSGTSGTPRAAMLSHRALLANLDQMMAITDPAPMTEDDISLIVLPLFHIYALNAALGLVAKAGATAVLVDRFEPDLALDFIHEFKVTNIAGAPTMYIAWSADPTVAHWLAGVRILHSGSAPLAPAVFEQFQTMGLTIWEGYGMTETAPVITSTLAAGHPGPGSVGHSLPGIYIRLVDEQGNDVDEGDPGELVLHGDNLFSGYWPDGADGPDQNGWWATGDVAIADFDGNLRIVDRRRDLILVSGFNVYPREIENVLAEAPGVAEVAVVGVPHPYTGEAVKALVVARAGETVTPENVVAFGSRRLARFKCPTIVEIVDELPRSIAGKVMKGPLRVAAAEAEMALAQANARTLAVDEPEPEDVYASDAWLDPEPWRQEEPAPEAEALPGQNQSQNQNQSQSQSQSRNLSLNRNLSPNLSPNRNLSGSGPLSLENLSPSGSGGRRRRFL